MDPVANMIVAIKNGYMAKKESVRVPYSKFKLEIAKVLEKEKFVDKVKKEDLALAIDLAYEKGKPAISEIKKVSKLGLRVYTKNKHISKIKGGKGIFIISTPQGVMGSKEAKKKGLGGEVVCLVW